MRSHRDDQVESILANARLHSRRPWRLEIWLHPELKELSSAERRELLDRAELEAKANVNVIWQAAGIAAATMFGLILLAQMPGQHSGVIGIMLGAIGGTLLKQFNLYKATRNEIDRIRLLRLAERGEA